MKKIKKNIIWGFGGQLLSLAISIILPRLIIVNFGSETNGITSTITQIFVYVALLESGIGSAALTCLYKNIAENDQSGIAQTISAAHKYYKKLLPLYLCCVLALAIVFPLIIDTTVSAKTIRFLILIQGACGTVNFLFTNAHLQLLVADGRTYVSSILTLLVKVISVSGQILLIAIGYDIVSVQFSALLAYILQAIVVNLYVKKKYPWLTVSSDADISILDQRRSFIIHEVSGVVFQSTDLFLISVFCSIKEASIYAVYSMIFSALGNLMSILMRSIDFNLGAEYHRDLQKYIKIHDFYETLYVCFVFAVISAAYLVTLPFIRLYTAGVTDVQYSHPALPFLFSAIQILSCGRMVCSKLIAVSGRAKDTIPNTLAEMVINIVASILLVNLLGMVGVLLGTILALLYRTNDILMYANKKVLHRSPWSTYKTLLINLLLFGLFVFISNIITINADNYLQFIVHGLFALVSSLLLYYSVHLALNTSFRRELLTELSRLTRRLKKEPNNH